MSILLSPRCGEVALRIPVLLFIMVTFLTACQQGGTVDLEGLKGRAQSGDPAACRKLVALLGEADRELHARIYPFLLELGDQAIPYLLEEVATSDRIRREQVIAALGNLKASQAAAPIARILADRSLQRRYVAAWALGEIDSPAALPALIAALDDDDPEVARYAVRALVRLNRKAIEHLLAYLPEASPRGAAGAVRALGDIGDPIALDSLLRQADGPSRPEVLRALGKLKDKRAEAVLIAGLSDPQWRHRMFAAMALGGAGTAAAVPQLRVALEDEEMVVREWAARSLEVLTGEHVTFRNDQGEQVLPYSIYH